MPDRLNQHHIDKTSTWATPPGWDVNGLHAFGSNGTGGRAAAHNDGHPAAQGLWDLDLKSLWEYRELLYFLVWRDVKVRYKQTAFGGPVVPIDRDRDQWSKQPLTNPERVTNPENLVYVIYTSGSTGTPKGVAVRHRNLVNYKSFIRRRLKLEEFGQSPQFATVSTLGADLGNTCIYPSLLSGGCLHVIGHDVAADSDRLRAYMAKHPVDSLKIVPSHLMALLNAGGGKDVLPRKYLILGGEALTIALVEKILVTGGTCEVLNHYGPTETTVGSLTLRLNDFDWKDSPAQTIPIGRPIANTRIYVLDAMGEPVPIELQVSSTSVAKA